MINVIQRLDELLSDDQKTYLSKNHESQDS